MAEPEARELLRLARKASQRGDEREAIKLVGRSLATYETEEGRALISTWIDSGPTRPPRWPSSGCSRRVSATIA